MENKGIKINVTGAYRNTVFKARSCTQRVVSTRAYAQRRVANGRIYPSS